MMNIDFWDPEYLTIALQLLGAVAAGSVIGLERSFHGRPAGFRTHALVCLASTLLMLISLYQSRWIPTTMEDVTQLDPTRMAQGIMTGIGFLGAGVIYKEDFTIRGLTTAASIWITAAIGILIGVGFYFPVVITTLLAFGILSVFRFLENRMPGQYFSHYTVAFHREEIMPEGRLREILKESGFVIAQFGYRTTGGGKLLEYETVIQTTNPENIANLAKKMCQMQTVQNFELIPRGD
jgi:putative Mg2+ transporter-C (MgtC) family protein